MELKTKKARPLNYQIKLWQNFPQLSESEKEIFQSLRYMRRLLRLQYGFKFDEFDSDEDSLLILKMASKVLLDQLYPLHNRVFFDRLQRGFNGRKKNSL